MLIVKGRDTPNMGGRQICIGSCLKYSSARVIDTLDLRVQQGTHIGNARPARCQ
jgi:hypothetical protein